MPEAQIKLCLVNPLYSDTKHFLNGKVFLINPGKLRRLLRRLSLMKKMWIIKKPKIGHWALFLNAECGVFRFFQYSLFLSNLKKSTWHNFSNIFKITIMSIFSNSQKTHSEEFTKKKSYENPHVDNTNA